MQSSRRNPTGPSFRAETKLRSERWCSGLHCTGVNSLVDRNAVSPVALLPDKALAILRAAPKTRPNDSSRTEVWYAVLAGCVEKGPDYALAAIQSAPRDAQESGMHSLLSAMAARDPRAALAWSDALPPEL